MIEYSFVPIHLVAAEIAPNVARHHREMNENDEYGTPNIDWDSYIQAGVSGHCMAVTARDDGKLIGYAVFDIGINPRYKHRLEASSAGIFVEKEYRGEVSLSLLDKCDTFLSGIGVRETSYVIKDEKFEKVLARKGYEPTYKVWSRDYGV